MIKRGRRLRANAAIRDMVRETTLNSKDFIYPIFVVEWQNIKNEISSLEGNYHYSVDRLDEVIKEVKEHHVHPAEMVWINLGDVNVTEIEELEVSVQWL